MSPFSVALRQLRAEYDVAQGELADRLGLRQSYISQLERGTKLPKDKDLVRKIVRALRKRSTCTVCS
ncbi:helix-turn-helix transcriptional regulator [Burkholderia pyrrocinia]|uniref:helix-turn-helix transcriptional regulator n=1 Tax=Burkholderia pyrrocinia TaxID=60550 RepID=UPI00158D0975|nr:helix-turn-helix transcriptional regulator [Burkholderia pyrrocinia]